MLEERACTVELVEEVEEVEVEQRMVSLGTMIEGECHMRQVLGAMAYLWLTAPVTETERPRTRNRRPATKRSRCESGKERGTEMAGIASGTRSSTRTLRRCPLRETRAVMPTGRTVAATVTCTQRQHARGGAETPNARALAGPWGATAGAEAAAAAHEQRCRSPATGIAQRVTNSTLHRARSAGSATCPR